MKYLKQASFPVLAAILLTLNACSPTPDLRTTAPEILVQDIWLTGYYFSGHDQTARFHDYQFRFHGNGNMQANHSGMVETGHWAVIRDAERNEVLLMQWSDTHPDLSSLNSEWTVISMLHGEVVLRNNHQEELRLIRLN